MAKKVPGRNGGTLILREKGDPALPGAGKPEGATAKTIIKKWLMLTQSSKNGITGDIESLSQFDLIALAQVKKALKGDTYAFNALLDRTEGKPPQALEHSGEIKTGSMTDEQFTEIRNTLIDLKNART